MEFDRLGDVPFYILCDCCILVVDPESGPVFRSSAVFVCEQAMDTPAAEGEATSRGLLGGLQGHSTVAWKLEWNFPSFITIGRKV